MTDPAYHTLLKTLYKELRRRYGTEMCSELNADCAGCKISMFEAFVNMEIDMVKWYERRDKKSIKK